MTDAHDGDLAAIRAVYDHSTDQFVAGVGTTVSPDFEAPLDMAVLDVFAAQVAQSGDRAVLDVGCGPGRIAGRLAARGLDARGIDLSPRMVQAARIAHPDLAFEEGALAALPVPDSSMAGVVCWYSIIATPPAGLAEAWREIHRVLAPGGKLLVAFQVGEGEPITSTQGAGSPHTLTLYRHDVDHVTDAMHDAGLAVHAQVVRQPALPHEVAPQAFIMAATAR